MVDLIIGGSSCQILAKEISDELKVELGAITTTRFPDGELYVRIDSDVKDKECAVIQSTCRPQDSNLFELFAILETLKDLGAKRITTVVPYFGYGRQDKRFKPGEAISARVAAKHISLHSDEFYAVNIHEKALLKFFQIPAQALDAAPALGEYFKSYELVEPLVIGPDDGAKDLAEGVSKVLGCKCDVIEKKRIAPGKVEMKKKELNAKDKDVVIVDDIIDSGSTVLSALEMLRSQDAANVFVGCVHPVLTGNIAARLFAAGSVDVVATNTIPSQISFITASSVIAPALSK